MTSKRILTSQAHEIMGRYWDAAFKEGRTGIHDQGLAAGQCLLEMRNLIESINIEPCQALTQGDDEMRKPITMTHDQEREAFVNVKPVIVADAPDAHQVWLDVGCQHFTVGEYCETKDEAEWLAGQLETAIDEMLPTYANQQFDSLISDMEQQAKTFLSTENTEIFGWIKRLKAWQAAKREPVGEAVYMIADNGDDRERQVSAAEYENYDGIKRILFTHPPEAKDAVVVDTRILELAERLVSPGAKASNVSASECHEISDFIFDLHAKTTTPSGG